MERLLDLYVAREIMPEEYQRKKAKLLNEKQELKEALGEIERGSGGWLEPAKAFLTTCHEASSVAWQENPAAAKQFLRTVGSNFVLNNRRLCLTYNSPFLLVAQEEGWKKWLPGQDSNLRHADYRLPLRFRKAWTISSPYRRRRVRWRALSLCTLPHRFASVCEAKRSSGALAQDCRTPHGG